MAFLQGTLAMLKELIGKYPSGEIRYDHNDRASVEKALDILEEDYNHIEKIHHLVHRMRRHLLLAWQVIEAALEEKHGKKRKLRHGIVKPDINLLELKRKLPQVPEKELRGRLAVEVAGTIIKLTRSSWPTWLALLANAKGDQSVMEPKPTPGEDLPPGWSKVWEDELAEEVLVRWNELLEDEEGKTKQELKKLVPPLTWGEVLYYFYDYLQEISRDKADTDCEKALSQRKKLDCLFYPPGRHYCFYCDRPFNVSKYHPYRSICSSCTTSQREARYRQRKK